MLTRSNRFCRALRGAALIAVLATVGVEPLFAVSRFFVAHFRGHTLGVHLQDEGAAFEWRHGQIRRRPHEGVDRRYIRTVRADYLSADWTYEVTFRSPASGPDELLLVGIGEAVPDSSFYDEPRNSLTFRIHQGITGFSIPGWRVDVAAHDVGMFSFTFFQEIGTLGGPQGGTYTARLRKVGGQITFEILGTAIALMIPNILAAAPFLAEVPTHLFFGSLSPEYSFSEMRVLPERR